jgi:hypothetical protein
MSFRPLNSGLKGALNVLIFPVRDAVRTFEPTQNGDTTPFTENSPNDIT